MMKKILLASMILTINSCSLLSPVAVQPQEIYQINAKSTASVKPTRAKTLVVTNAQNNAIYTSTQMVYTTRPYQVAYFSKNRWAETPINMIQNLTITALQKSRLYKNVVGGSSTNANYALVLSLNELQQDFMLRPSVIHLKIHAQLIRLSTNQTVATKDFSYNEPAYQNTPYAGVIATNIATQKFLTQVIQFCQRNT